MRMWAFWLGNWNSVFSRWESGSELLVFPTWVFFIIDVFLPILEKNRATSPPESRSYPFSLEPKAGLWKSERIQLFPLYLSDWFDDLTFFPTWKPNSFFDRSILRRVDWCPSLLDCWLYFFWPHELPSSSFAQVDWRLCSSFDNISCFDLTTSLIFFRPDNLLHLFPTDNCIGWPTSFFSARRLTSADLTTLLYFSLTLRTITRVDQHFRLFLNNLITSSSLTNPPLLFSRHCPAGVQCLPNVFFFLILIQRSLLPSFHYGLFSCWSFCSWAKLCSPKSFFDYRVCNYYCYIRE